MDVSVIIVSYNSKQYIEKTLNSLYKQTNGLDFEVFVVDNGSLDGTVEMIKQEFQQVKILETGQNSGFAKANNIAIRMSEAKYVFLLNPDTVLIENSIKKFYDFMEDYSSENIGCCGGLLLNEDMSAQISYGIFPSLLSMTVLDSGASVPFKNQLRKILYSFRNKYKFGKDGKKYKKVDYVCGADMFIRKDILDNAGLFDEDFFLYFEEMELCYRMKRKGYKSVIFSETKIIHSGSSAGEASMFKFREFKKSELIYFEKCCGRFIRNLVKIFYLIKYTLNFGFENNYLEKIRIIYGL
jgi:GT2 family glycosyltransferase